MVTVISGGSHSGRDKVFIDKIKSAVKNGEQVMVCLLYTSPSPRD